MSDSLYIGAAGMRAQQQNVDTIANNLANANTNNFKKSRIHFSEMLVPDIGRSSLNSLETDSLISSSINSGVGVSIASIRKIFEAGELKKTESPMDIAIQGDGFIEVEMRDGSTAYSRGGSLIVNNDGLLALPSGLPLKANISVPEDVKRISISAQGEVRLFSEGQVDSVDVGQIELVRFMNPSQLTAQPDGLYLSSDGSGQPVTSLPGENGVGSLAQGFVEASNVKMVDEMVNLMIAQRAYEANVKLVQAADEMLGLVNNLRK